MAWGTTTGPAGLPRGSVTLPASVTSGFLGSIWDFGSRTRTTGVDAHGLRASRSRCRVGAGHRGRAGSRDPETAQPAELTSLPAHTGAVAEDGREAERGASLPTP